MHKHLILGALICLALSAPSFAQDTRTVVDDLGRTVEIPADPQRVVIAGNEEHAAMLTSIGYVPYGLMWGYHPEVIQTLEGIGGDVGDLSTAQILGDSSNPDHETIAAADPDLIIMWNDPEAVEKMALLAPTLGYNPRQNNSGDYGDASGERYSKQRTIASLVGMADALNAQIIAYEAQLADVKARHGDLITTLEWTFIDTGDDFQPHMYDAETYPTFAYNAVMTDLGLKRANAMAEATKVGLGFDDNFGYAQISLEVIPDYAADLIFVGRYDDKPLDGQLETVLSATAAAKADQVIRVDSNVWTYHLVQAEIQLLRQIDEILSEGVQNLGDF
ncbi:ABC transporter substrate-binding protein [Cognatiyoonia sp. IB215182]|uniref:ABC transporter substrate-binding protein n=1 Tax=Cognatiyoonia sp. IB215182 TaxID=3097353 RepID=UPI002A0D4BC7|nr:ABC transporter substrate-binding protein [Cognatiyoonia sp. IB215182]MDX8354778.1 ABC transporter substrate-binding protein [Cognatiyoonia sp. IB215182]